MRTSVFLLSLSKKQLLYIFFLYHFTVLQYHPKAESQFVFKYVIAQQQLRYSHALQTGLYPDRCTFSLHIPWLVGKSVSFEDQGWI